MNLIEKIKTDYKSSEREDTLDYWNKFYKKCNIPLSPSSFAEFVTNSGYLKAGDSLLDVGCGNGRDTFHFLKNGINALGIDGSTTAIESNINCSLEMNISAPPFENFDILKENLHKYASYFSIYARFFLHAIPEKGEKIFFEFLSSSQAFYVFLEFRTLNDPLFIKGERISDKESYTDHYRRFLDFNEITAKLSALPFETIYQTEAIGLSRHEGDNPVLGRIVLKRAS